ncbi:hypothetical protein EBBID32_35550 [Sphingobium indicum BiD32]|uniref:Uncharacterized protein n=1 Tax=Sphingobium indicum BiD32 TaxID=1301087 RepID=N1MR50_9SPHN|nr:hypothetical protein EBBID32_35550 [Sphingobium indicum BiD32]
MDTVNLGHVVSAPVDTGFVAMRSAGDLIRTTPPVALRMGS